MSDTKCLLKVCLSVVRRTVIYHLYGPLVWDKDDEIRIIIGQPDGRITKEGDMRFASDMDGQGK